MIECVDATSVDLAHGEVDVLITDPPYSLRVHRDAATMQGGTARKRDLGFTPLAPELQEYIARCTALVKRWSVIYTDIQGLGAWEFAVARHIRSVPVVWHREEDEIAGAGVVGVLPWVRWSMPQLSADRPTSGCEMLVIAHAPGKMRWSGPGNLTHLSHKCLRGGEKHQTQKPLDQALDLVAWFTAPDEMVYDPCAGRGTIGVACALLGRQHYGCEIDEREARLANTRIANARDRVLVPSDRSRFERWLSSVGASADSDVRGARFKKGKIQ